MRNITDAYQAKSQVHLDEEGNVITEMEEIKTRWKEYFKDLLKEQDILLPEIDLEIPQQVDNFVQPPQEREIDEIIRKMRNNKSPGSDTITAEMLKYGGEELLRVSHELISKVWEQERMPEEWKKGLIIPIYKKGDRRDSARSQRAMLEKLEDIERAVSKVGLTINWEKTKYLKMTRMGQRGVDLEAQRIRWLGHLTRMNDNRVVKKVAEWTPPNTRPKGRPRMRWRDDVVADLRKIGARNWREVVEDRPQWRLLIHQAKTHGGL
ncbi:uncharacterized protein LOC124355923 [Homalodisca vitripennis]|uniref:uncharacterized protein LOC124355923 n=1 Tax=Homalodisca vitripennis TaxID=197043 RepID=UPI001EEA10D1|nr:uncharacterized protein LOC124355923 [Homalodisca vitripennis]